MCWNVVTKDSPLSVLKAGYVVKGVVTEVRRNGVCVSVSGLPAEIFYYHLRQRVRAEVGRDV